MLISASSEFIALCRSQVTLLTQGMGAALSVVYLTEELMEGGTHQAGLVPVVAYPETAAVWEGTNVLASLPETKSGEILPRQLKALQPKPGSEKITTRPLESSTDAQSDSQLWEAALSLLPQRQMVVPLIYQGVMMGFLVTSREDRPWNERERSEIEQIAQTLALAIALDQRREWLEGRLSQQQRLLLEKRDLLDNLLHQFRNPLTALRTFGKLLLKRLRPGDANRTVADNIVRESDRLQELLQQFDRVIDLSADDLAPPLSLPAAPPLMPATEKPAAQTLPLLPDAGVNTELCLVVDVLEPLIASATAIAQERSLELHSEIPPNLPQVRANAKALREVLSNLIDNALKYTPPGGKIDIQAGLERGDFQGIAISDTGPGIPPQDLAHVFERHYRGVQQSSGIPGTGLGLAIALDLVEQMQGEIQVKSPAVDPTISASSGPGATFIVWLKLGR